MSLIPLHKEHIRYLALYTVLEKLIETLHYSRVSSKEELAHMNEDKLISKNTNDIGTKLR